MKIYSPASLAMATLALTLSAAPTQAQSIFEACAADISAHCASVEPGDGRLSACLYAHEDKLSDGCDGTFGEVADILDVVFERLRYVSQQCGNDIRTHCGDVELGQGKMFSCLHGKRASLSATCSEVIDSVQLPTD